MIITGPTLATKTNLVDRLKRVLGQRCVAVFTGTRPHVPRSTVFSAADEARQTQADILVSFGGSTKVVTARGVALVLAERLTRVEELDRFKVRVEYPGVEIPSMTQPAMPIVAIPTTLSAGEYTAGGGITNEKTGVKEHYIDDQLAPKVVILDPEMTLQTPPWLWVSTGIKALDHAVEFLYAPGHQPATDAPALHAIRLLFEYLPRCYTCVDDLDSRTHCLVGAWLSIFGWGNVSTGLSHAIGHQLGARCNVPHGYTSCVILPHVMDFNFSHTAACLARVATALGINTQGLTQEEAAEESAKAIREFIASFSLPQRLRDVGVRKSDFAELADATLRDRSAASNPKPVTRADILRILQNAW
jgi:alcohol dehydrogenase